jgi:hypothetical protein
MSRKSRSRTVDRERFERMKSIFDWLNRQFADSDQCFRDLISLLDRLRHMQSRSLPKRDLEIFQGAIASTNWLAFHAQLREEIWQRIIGVNLYDMWKGPDPVPPPPDLLKKIDKFRKYGDFDPLQSPHRIIKKKGSEGEFYFEEEVKLLPIDFDNGTPRESYSGALHIYLLDIFFGDLVGMNSRAIGHCYECGKLYVNRRRIMRRFCSATCRWRHAVRSGISDNKAVGKKRARASISKPISAVPEAIALFDELDRRLQGKPD